MNIKENIEQAEEIDKDRQISQLQSRIEDLESWLADSEGATTNAIALTKENAQLQEKYDALWKEMGELNTRNHELLGELIQLQEKLEAWKTLWNNIEWKIMAEARYYLYWPEALQKLRDLGEI